MIRPVLFTPAARRDLVEAYDWYEHRVAGLGMQFRTELTRQVERIASQPQQFPLVLADVRRARLQRFPYSLFFRELHEDIFVIACFHSSRDPGVWQSRA